MPSPPTRTTADTVASAARTQARSQAKHDSGSIRKVRGISDESGNVSGTVRGSPAGGGGGSGTTGRRGSTASVSRSSTICKPPARPTTSSRASSRLSQATNASRPSPPTPRAREKPPSKDGTAQRHAKEVEGLKDYQLGHILGRGAFGSVYCALNWSTGETVAIKQVRLSDMPSSSHISSLTQEIDLLKNLHHPNIVKYHGFVQSTDSLYIILEYCEQGSLHSICKNFGKFPENLVGLYTVQVLQGLQFLHEQGVIHRDIKGANILTTKEGLVKLADFGVATSTNVATGQGMSESSVVGTPYWMAPEVIELSGATTASDIWSLGCTVIELLSGKPPYSNFAPMPALFRIVNDDHPPLPEGASPMVRDFLMQCFQKDPNLRVSAKKLLKHPWITASAKKANTKAKVKLPEYDEAVRSVQQWNEALKASPPQAHAGNGGIRRPASRPVSRSSADSGHAGLKSQVKASPARGTKPAFRLASRKSAASQFQSPPSGNERRDANKDNWDADFESLNTSMGGLHIPDRLNFAQSGLFSSEKLKLYANIDTIPEVDGKVEGWDEDFEGDLTMKSPFELAKGDAMETVRPFYPPQTSSEEMKHNPPTGNSVTGRRALPEKHERKISKESQPRTQILRPAQIQKQTAASAAKATSPKPLHKRPAAPARPASKDQFVEDGDDEDYSDLIPTSADEQNFRKKLAGFSPSPSKPYDLRNIQTRIGGSMRRRRTHTPTRLVHDAAAMKRTRSNLEIQKYAEDDEDEDFADLLFSDGQVMNLNAGAKSRSPKSAISFSSRSSSSSTTFPGEGTLKLSNSMTWGDDDDEEDDDDPFAALEEELDSVDLEENVVRDKHARLCAVVEGLVSDLKLGQPEEILSDIVEQLLQILAESPDVKSVIVISHGMLPILEILETATRPHIILRLVRIVNLIITDNMEVQENLCFVGGIPIITRFAHKKYPLEIRLEAAAFVRMLCSPPTLPSHASLHASLTLQMFVSCGGLNVLVEFLEEDYDSDAGRELVLVGVNGIWAVFELQGPTPKNDFCRIFSRSAVLYPLSLVLNRVLDERSEPDAADALQAEIVEGRIVNIFLLFSQAENHVKETVADRMVLKRVLKDLRRMSPAHQITMLKFIKNLSMLATTLDALQNSNAIEVLTDLLSASPALPHAREISNQVLATMYNLCRLSKARQEDAALSGLVPLLQRLVQTERPLKEFALPILCDMAHSGKVGRKILWQNKGLQFYVRLLSDPYWAVTALDAIFVWLQEETAKVEEQLLAPRGAVCGFAEAIVQCFNESKADAFENLLEPLQKLLRLSPPVAASLAHRSLFERSAVKVHAKKALVRLNLLRVIRSICDACAAADEGDEALLRRYPMLLDAVRELARNDPAILVREMANELVKSSEMSPLAGVKQRQVVPGYGMRRSSSNSFSQATPGPGSPVPTAHNRLGGGERERRSYFDLSSAAVASTTAHGSSSERRMAPSPSQFRSAKRNGSASSTGYPRDHSASSLASMKSSSRLQTRQSTAVLPLSRAGSRLSLAPTTSAATSGNLRENSGVRGGTRAEQTPTHAHAPMGASARLAQQQQASLAMQQQRRRRRQTSGAENGGR